MKRVLLVDDSKDYCYFMKEFLETHEFAVHVAFTALDGISLYKEKMFDLVITDLQMKEIDGIQFMSLIRELYPEAKIIILTNSESEEDEFRGLDFNADEYIKKDTGLKVILKRINRVLSQKKEDSSEIISSSGEELIIKLRTRKVYKEEEVVALTKKEYDLLLLFMKNKNRVLSRDTILRNLWGSDEQLVDSRVIDTHIKQIRSKLALTSIYSVRGVGYEWVE